MNNIRDIATTFEGVKIAMTQDKNGHILKLSIHPNDTPESIMRDPVGTRYTVALVRLNEQDEPVASQQDDEGIRAIRLAAALCDDPEFQMYMASIGWAEEPTEDSTTQAMREHLGVTSRKELRINSEARRRLVVLRDDFAHNFRRGNKGY